MEDVSPAIRDFVLERLNSIEQLSILVLLAADPAREWSVDALSRELRSSPSAITRRLDDLYGNKVLEAPRGGAGVRYSPTSNEVAAMVAETLEVFRDRPNRVIELLYSRPHSSLNAFADAFKLKKDKP